MLNPVNILKFIGERNPKYHLDKVNKSGMVLPLEGEGSFDEKGKQGVWVRYHNLRNENIIKTKFLYKDDKLIWRDSYNAIGDHLTHFDNISQIMKHYFIGSDKIRLIENIGNGHKGGEYEEFYINGKIKEIGKMVKGYNWGLKTSYYENGNIEMIAHYIGGNLYGPYKEFDEDGNLTISGYYKQNKENGLFKFYKNGKLSYEKEYQDGFLVVRPNVDLKFDLE